VISFDDPIGRILNFYRESAHHTQMSLLLGKNLGDITNLASDYLPKPAIDRTTIKMAEILQHRMGAASSPASSSSPVANPATTGGVLA
jgi:hypothetical protein